MAISVIAVVAASTITTLVAGQLIVVVLVLIVGLAIGSAIRPDSHTATAAEAVVVLQWLVSTRDETTAWAILTALCLLVFHMVIALMALTPITATIDRSILLRWSRRGGWIAVATIGTWALVLAMAERRAPGSAALTVVGFVTLSGLILVTSIYSASSEQDEAQ
jgi:hypothetical protein